MNYSEEFKKALLSYDNSDEIRRMLDEGDTFIGRMLDDSRMSNAPTSEEIVKAFETAHRDNNPEPLINLYKKAKKMLRANELYSQWAREYDRYLKSRRGGKSY